MPKKSKCSKSSPQTAPTVPAPAPAPIGGAASSASAAAPIGGAASSAQSNVTPQASAPKPEVTLDQLKARLETEVTKKGNSVFIRLLRAKIEEIEGSQASNAEVGTPDFEPAYAASVAVLAANSSSKFELRIASRQNGFAPLPADKIEVTPTPAPALVVEAPAPAPAPGPVVEAPAPVVTEQATAPVVAEQATAPVVAEQATAPVVTEQATAPVVAEQATAPVVAEQATAPVVTEQATAPVVTEQATAPVVAEQATAPGEAAAFSSQQVAGGSLQAPESAESVSDEFVKSKIDEMISYFKDLNSLCKKFDINNRKSCYPIFGAAELIRIISKELLDLNLSPAQIQSLTNFLTGIASAKAAFEEINNKLKDIATSSEAERKFKADKITRLEKSIKMIKDFMTKFSLKELVNIPDGIVQEMASELESYVSGILEAGKIIKTKTGVISQAVHSVNGMTPLAIYLFKEISAVNLNQEQRKFFLHSASYQPELKEFFPIIKEALNKLGHRRLAQQQTTNLETFFEFLDNFFKGLTVDESEAMSQSAPQTEISYQELSGGGGVSESKGGDDEDSAIGPDAGRGLTLAEARAPAAQASVPQTDVVPVGTVEPSTLSGALGELVAQVTSPDLPLTEAPLPVHPEVIGNIATSN